MLHSCANYVCALRAKLYYTMFRQQASRERINLLRVFASDARAKLARNADRRSAGQQRGPKVRTALVSRSSELLRNERVGSQTRSPAGQQGELSRRPVAVGHTVTTIGAMRVVEICRDLSTLDRSRLLSFGQLSRPVESR